MTRPILILPIVLQLLICLGLILFVSFVGIWYVSSIAQEGTPFYALFYALFYLLQSANPSITTMAPPEAFMTPEGLTLAMQGATSLEFIGVATILLLVSLLFLAVTAYTKSLVIGIARNAANKSRTSVIELFRAGRAYWFPTSIVLLPYALLLWIIVVTSIPILIMNVHYAILKSGVPWNSWIVVRLVAIILLVLYALCTFLAEGVIAHGSKHPVRESIAYLILKWKNSLATLTLLLLVGFVMLVLDAAQGSLLPMLPALAGMATTIAFFVLVALWRMWTTFFVVSRVR